MTSGGAEALRAAVRRSLVLIIGLIVLGIVAVNVFKEIQGPRYGADARVLISTTPLSSIITGNVVVDAERLQQTAVGIASAPEIYENAASETDGRFGDADELRSATEVTAEPNSDLLRFSAETSESETAVGTVNAVAESYIAFRDDLARSAIQDTLEGLRERLSDLPAESPGRTELEAQAARFEAAEQAPSEAELVEPATSADQTSPNLLRDSLVGFSIGLVIALLAVALREAVDTTVRSEADVEDLLSAPVLASVRPLPRRTRIVTYGRHEASFADTYALLAAQLTHEDGKQATPQVLAVTSAIAEEGKTSTASNLAVALGRRGIRVLLADFDFRKASLAELFGIPNEAPGALQIMSDAASLEDVLWSVSLEGSRPVVSQDGAAPPARARVNRSADESPGSLELLPSGGVTPARQLPQRRRLAELLRTMRAHADVVILDTPPALLTVEVSELSRLIDTVLVVVRQGRATQRNLRALGRQARTWPVALAGAVMTDVRTEGEYSYYRRA